MFIFTYPAIQSQFVIVRGLLPDTSYVPSIPGVRQSDASMAVLIQEQFAADVSFVLHTEDPLAPGSGTLVAELAVGLGETLASGTRGTPWRMAVDKAAPDAAVKTLAFANFSKGYVTSGGGASKGGSGGVQTATRQMRLEVIDYSKQRLSGDETERTARGRQLAQVGCETLLCSHCADENKGDQCCALQNPSAMLATAVPLTMVHAVHLLVTQVGKLLEEEFGGPQDVEGCFVGQDLYIVQTRPQP